MRIVTKSAKLVKGRGWSFCLELSTVEDDLFFLCGGDNMSGDNAHRQCVDGWMDQWMTVDELMNKMNEERDVKDGLIDFH